MKNKIISKKQLLLVTVFVALVIVMSTVFAVVLSQKEAENVFTGARTDVAVLEEGVTDGVATFSSVGESYVAEKAVSVKNTSSGEGAVPEYVRVCIIPKYINNTLKMQTAVTDFESDTGDFPTINGNTYTMSDVTFTLAEDWQMYWSYSNNYFYYKEQLAVGDTTKNLLESVSMKSSVLDEYTKNGLSLKVVVLADAIQTVGGAVESRWADSGLNSNDVLRPNTENAVSAYSLEEDEATSDSVVDYIGDYDMQLAEKMVSSISVTIYEPPADDDTEEDADEATYEANDKDSDEDNEYDTDDDTEDDIEPSQGTRKKSIGDYEQVESTPHIVGEDDE